MSLVVWSLFCAAAVVITGTRGAPAGKCQFGEDIINILFNSTTSDGEDYGVENVVGLAGNLEDILADIKETLGSPIPPDVVACLHRYKETTKPPSKASSSAASSLGYNRPDHLGGLEALPVPEPSDDSLYGYGYTTYQKPFKVEENVKDYKPNPYMKANSFQNLFLLMYDEFLNQWNSLFDGNLTPKYWNNYPNEES